MIFCVVRPARVPILNYATFGAIISTGCINGILTIIPFWKLTFFIPKNGSIFLIRKKTTSFDTVKGLIYLGYTISILEGKIPSAFCTLFNLSALAKTALHRTVASLPSRV
ncbi:hypothetical protein ALQ30_200366 [Pseudomonas syringae pv. persicae]|uniref:Uncharacterized protein n=1 Tax=Pseudomonas syringae pv. persicae TaxID=237306 RepID=A0A3M3ZZJ4_9PSED|nr:hypothetical protein ALQ30_200366 [Pseudomonas syringae pv. persicae]